MAFNREKYSRNRYMQGSWLDTFLSILAIIFAAYCGYIKLEINYILISTLILSCYEVNHNIKNHTPNLGLGVKKDGYFRGILFFVIGIIGIFISIFIPQIITFYLFHWLF
jgi:beta-lactamase regulating signal transducer with metallopeptidase domain